MTQYHNPVFALGTFAEAGQPAFAGLVINHRVLPLSDVRQECAALGHKLRGETSVLALLEHWSHNISVLQYFVTALADETLSARLAPAFIPVENLHILPPVNLPRQVFCAGANYFTHVVDLIVDMGPERHPDTSGMSPEQLRAHAEAMMRERQLHGEPYIFSKPVSAVTGARDAIELLDSAVEPDWELELAVVIGRPAFQVSRQDAMDCVAGYTIANDITNRGQLYPGGSARGLGTDWLSSKGSPGYLPLGPYLVPATCVPDPMDLRITLSLNGETKQDESTSDMLFDIPRLLEYLTRRVRLYPGDVLCTGSPAGNGTHYQRFLTKGDVLEGHITGLGTQRNPIGIYRKQ